MDTHHPTISVVCPTYNSASFVSDTIQSVLRQTTAPLELIVADDGSSDDTMATVERLASHAPFPVHIIRNSHRGPGAARNAGIRAAQGVWIALLDSDDSWKPEKIARVTEAIVQHPEANFFCHDQWHRTRDGREERLHIATRYQGMVVARQLFRSCPFATSAVVCRRDLLMHRGLFNEALPSAQDYELWLRMAPDLRVRYLDEALGWYVDRPGNISSRKRWRHLRNELWALWKNRHHTTRAWYAYGVAHHIAAFGKHQLMRFIARPCR